MTQPLDESLHTDLQAMAKAGTLKTFRHITGPMDTEVGMAEKSGRILVLSSNNYLGLADHPEVIAAGKAALDKYGAGTASVRFICGTFEIHKEIEQTLARLSRTHAALTYVSCWAANTGLIPAVAGEGDAIVSDALNHASLIDGCRAAKAKRLVYRHSDIDDLREKLADVRDARRIFIVTDGVFSMEGDIAKLPDIVTLAKRYNAAIILDDSHGVGVMGKHGRGTAEHWGVEGEIAIVTGTLGKALGGAAGGYVAGSETLIEYLSQVSRPQLFSNALPATIAASAKKAIEILEREPERVTRLHALAKMMREGLKKLGFKPLEGASAIVPIIVGDTAFAIKMSQELLGEGIFITGFGYPVVPEGTARLRIQMCASLTDEQVAFALEKFEVVGKRLGVI
ncbi:glycine C-acetyltransferase [Rhizomicrobium electricum]|uniref:Glycine C-acetyltransferase n=1 Tax=Rhizomicrobium electricum TaxID=480070 RepID=A0ABP3NZ28_9PROT|nr:glycine C-acetyltransferase [Rhizomicrobium electricum]NIJ47252.1 glycine C-acetyltransferase [Rhizomicrobium electricum]